MGPRDFPCAFTDKKQSMNTEIIGFVAGGLSSALFIPQIIKIFRERSAEEISLVTCIIGIVSSALWLYYGILNEHISMIVTNSISVVATTILCFAKLRFKDGDLPKGS